MPKFGLGCRSLSSKIKFFFFIFRNIKFEIFILQVFHEVKADPYKLHDDRMQSDLSLERRSFPGLVQTLFWEPETKTFESNWFTTIIIITVARQSNAMMLRYVLIYFFVL